jgi:hypothetical protein
VSERRASLSLLVILEAELPGGEPVELRVEARGVDYFRAEDLTGIDPWEVLGDLAQSSRLSNRFLRSLHALGYCAAKRVAPELVGATFDAFLDRAVEVSVVGKDDDGSAGEVAETRPTGAAAGSD